MAQAQAQAKVLLPQSVRGLQSYLPHNIENHYGLIWYKEAHAFARILAKESGLPIECVCGIIAVLSPAVSWDVNKRDALAIIRAENPRDVVVSTYGLNKTKAIHILETGDLGVIKGRKVSSFYHNILDPECGKHVTIDRHAIRAAYGLAGLNISPDDIPPVTSDKRYAHFARLYQRLADKLGLTPNQVQAIIWVEYKKKQA